jgi:hypothetical protein
VRTTFTQLLILAGSFLAAHAETISVTNTVAYHMTTPGSAEWQGPSQTQYYLPYDGVYQWLWEVHIAEYPMVDYQPTFYLLENEDGTGPRHEAGTAFFSPDPGMRFVTVDIPEIVSNQFLFVVDCGGAAALCNPVVQVTLDSAVFGLVADDPPIPGQDPVGSNMPDPGTLIVGAGLAGLASIRVVARLRKRN